MLNYKNTVVVSITTLVAMLMADAFVTLSIGWYIGIVLVALTAMIVGSVSIKSGYYLPSICFGDRNINAVAITFDDGPDEQFTPLILDILKEYKVKAAFFIVGSKAEKHPAIIQRMHNEGHIIGGHSYSHHFFFDFFPPKTMVQEMKQTDNIVFTLTGKKMRFFRPPYGVTNPFVAKAIKDMQYQSIGWSLKSNDTVLADEVLLLNNLIAKVENGDIILFHDNQPVTVKLLANFIQYLSKHNVSLVRLDTLINRSAYDN